jgi:HEAT repeat protein
MRFPTSLGGCLLPLMLTGLSAAAGQEPAAKKLAPPSAKEKAARDTLARLAKVDAGWKERMRAFVSLVKAGEGAVGPLVETLRTGSPENRAFAAGVLGVLADPAARPALEKALDDPEQAVRSQAILALRMLGPLKLTDRQRQALQGSNFHVRAHLEFALAREYDANPAAVRKALEDYDPTRIDTARRGQSAPDFSLPDLSGKTQRLSRIRQPEGAPAGQPVVVVFLWMDH